MTKSSSHTALDRLAAIRESAEPAKRSPVRERPPNKPVQAGRATRGG